MTIDRIDESAQFVSAFFEDENQLRAFVSQCDVVVHLAAMMRSPIEGEVYKVNIRLARQIIAAMEAEKVAPCILFSSSIQEGNGSEYGLCKQECRELLEKWARSNHTGFKGLLFPNLFGPGARPNSHSFIATFCYKLTHNEMPQVLVDNDIPLKFIGNLKLELLSIIEAVAENKDISTIQFTPECTLRVTEVLSLLIGFKNGKKPKEAFESDLFDTFESYKNYTLR